MAYNVLTGSIFRIPSSSLTITGAFAGDGGELTNLPIQTTSDAAATRIITFTNGIGNAVQGEENLTFNGSLLSVAGNVTASINVSASGFYGDGSNLSGIGGGAGGIFTTIDGANAYVTSSLNIGGETTPDHQVVVSGSLSSSTSVSASSFYGTYLNLKNTVDDGTTNRTLLRLHNERADDADVNDFGPISIDFEIENLDSPAKSGLARITAVQSPVGTNHTIPAGEKTSGLIFSTMNNDTLAEAMRINASGNVGIGTTDPSYELDVAGDAGFNEYIYHNGATDTFIQFEKDGGKNNINIEAGGENMFYLVSGSGGEQDAKATINNGLVDVDFQVKGAAEPNLIRTDAETDRVGIGVYPASASLHVVGDITASVNISASSFYGDGQNLTNLPAAAISSYTNPADNRIITSVNSSTVNAEGNLTFNSASSLLTVGGTSHLSGGVAHKRIAVINDYGVTLADYYLGVDTTSNTVKLTLPAASSAQVGQTFVIKDEGANTEANPITVSGSGADTIDGETQVQIESPYGALSLYTNGSHWFIY